MKHARRGYSRVLDELAAVRVALVRGGQSQFARIHYDELHCGDQRRSERSINAACILSGKSPCANSAKARENVASEGTCARRSQPRMRRSDLSMSRRSIRALVVGTPSIALATKALKRARRSAGRAAGASGRPGNKGFEADHVEGRDETPERFGHRVDFLTKPRKQSFRQESPRRRASRRWWPRSSGSLHLDFYDAGRRQGARASP